MAKNKLKKVANDSLVKSLIKRKAKKKPHIALSFNSLVKKIILFFSLPGHITAKRLIENLTKAA